MSNTNDKKIVDLNRLDRFLDHVETLFGASGDETVNAIPTSDIGGNIWIASD